MGARYLGGDGFRRRCDESKNNLRILLFTLLYHNTKIEIHVCSYALIAYLMLMFESWSMNKCLKTGFAASATMA